MAIDNMGHTFLNFLEFVLLENEKVEFASYNVPHPLISNTVMLIRTKKGKTPEKAFKEALEKIHEVGKELKQEFMNSLENWDNQ